MKWIIFRSSSATKVKYNSAILKEAFPSRPENEYDDTVFIGIGLGKQIHSILKVRIFENCTGAVESIELLRRTEANNVGESDIK